ncbi:MAG: TetR/AcrR family transcriptional regulator [Zetaproteobacteria bacterium]|nr:MAG: TetR/AcrR family transcriptional regulator [Zetaproteobacteria bacterium]
MIEHSVQEGRERILDAAEQLFAERGFAGTSVQRIAEQAMVSKATIFHHFENKQALYCAVVERACAGMLHVLDALLSDEQTRALDQLEAYRRQDMEEMFAHAPVIRLILRELTMGEDAQARALVDQVFGQHYLRLKALVSRAQRERLLRKDVDAGVQAVAVASINIFLFLVWPVLRHLPESPFEDLRQSGDSLFRLLLQGMQAEEWREP